MRFYFEWAIVIGLVFLSGCGGGTGGTSSTSGGDSTILVRGQVVASDDTPVKGAIVAVASTGQSTVTDAAGNYEMTMPQEGHIELNIVSNGQVVSLPIQSVQPGTSVLVVDARLEPATGRAEAQGFDLQVLLRGKCARFAKYHGDRVLIVLPTVNFKCEVAVVAQDRARAANMRGYEISENGCEEVVRSKLEVTAARGFAVMREEMRSSSLSRSCTYTYTLLDVPKGRTAPSVKVIFRPRAEATVEATPTLSPARKSAHAKERRSKKERK